MRVFYLGAIVATAGLWKLCGLSVVPLLLDYYGHQQALWFIGIISYLLMMVFSLRLLTLLREAKVQAMINQIRPHFLYNTLVTIYDLCKDAPEQAMSAILDFTRYLQANFTAISATELISFGEELEHTKAYTSTELLLFGDNLTVEYNAAFSAFRLPPLTLQPIVENAIKHGAGKGHSPEYIFVHTRAVDGGAEIIVEDNGVGYDPRPDGETHIGLQNVRERLEMMCGGTLEIAPRPGGGTVVTVFVPRGK